LLNNFFLILKYRVEFELFKNNLLLVIKTIYQIKLKNF